MKNAIYILSVALIITSCAPGMLPTSSDETYKEDLSAMMPRVDLPMDSTVEINNDEGSQEGIDYSSIEPQHDVTAQLNTVLDSIVSIRSSIRYIDGFTILVYSGTSSEKARIAKGKIYTVIPGSRPVLKYDEPNFRVKVGKYYSRLEAQQDYAALRDKFYNAIIIPERIYIN
ncbi:MAG: hypothetical protein ABJH05_14420 [Fulvivirga sp.]